MKYFDMAWKIHEGTNTSQKSILLSNNEYYIIQHISVFKKSASS